MSGKNYYEILGAAPSASERTLKNQFRKLMKLYHPDVNNSPDAVRRYAEIMEAYRTLSDKSSRTMYDLAHNFEGVSSDSTYDSPSPSFEDSTVPRKETMESRKQHYERLLREKRAHEQMQKDGSFTPYSYLARWRLWLVILGSSFVIAALSVLLERTASFSSTGVAVFVITGTAFVLTFLLWLVYLVFRLSAAYLDYQPPKAVLWIFGLPVSYLYDIVLGRSHGAEGYGSSFFMRIGNITFLPGLLIFFLIFTCGMLFLETKPRVKQMQRQGTEESAGTAAQERGRPAKRL
jgi:hypothetical protein